MTIPTLILLLLAGAGAWGLTFWSVWAYLAPGGTTGAGFIVAAGFLAVEAVVAWAWWLVP